MDARFGVGQKVMIANGQNQPLNPRVWRIIQENGAGPHTVVGCANRARKNRCAHRQTVRIQTSSNNTFEINGTWLLPAPQTGDKS